MMKNMGKTGLKVLGIWLILEGLIQLFDLSFDGIGIIMGILALVAGGLILAGK